MQSLKKDQTRNGYTTKELIIILCIFTLALIAIYIGSDNKKTYRNQIQEAKEYYLRASPKEKAYIKKHYKDWIPKK